MRARSQAPNIKYTPNTYTFSLGTAISTITPSNSGGNITTGSYSPVYSLATVNAPYDVTVDAAGDIYTMSESAATLLKISPTGTTTTLNSTTLYEPVGVAIDRVGNIYVSDFGDNTVYKFNTSGTLLATITGFNQPYGIAFDASNNAYVSDLGSGSIIKITAGTTTTSSYISGLTDPYGVAIDAAGNAYVSQYTLNNIVKITTAGVKTTFASGFNGPRQLSCDPSGNIYVADYGNNAIKKITSGGSVSTYLSTGLSNPRSVVLDASGNVYIADYGNNSIKKQAVTGYTINTALPAGLSFNTSTGAITGTPTTTFSATAYTVMGYNTSGRDNTTITLSCTQNTIKWDGSSSTSWTTAANWTPATVPSANDAIQIGVATFSNQPTISSTVNINSITLGKAKQVTLSIATGGTLNVTNSLVINTAATPTIKGAGAAAVNIAPGAVITVNGTGTLKLTAPLSFTLQSDATGDASISRLASTSVINGTASGSINVERYLRGGSAAYRGYRLLSSPVYNGTDTHSNNVYSINYLKNSIYLTGTTTSGGFDNTSAANPTLYLWREDLTPLYTTFLNSNYRGINNINSAPSYTIDIDGSGYYIPSGNAYLCFFRGDRSASTFTNETQTTYVPQAATLSTSGTLNIGQVTVKDWFTPTSSTLSYTSGSPGAIKGYNLVGNPYPSAIDWDNFQTSSTTTGIYGKNLNSTMYVLDPVTKTYGSYIAGSGGVGSATFVSNIISSGQGFFVVATATTAKLIFNETAKTTAVNTGTTLLMGQPANYAVNQYLRLQMSQDSTISDQTLIRFNSQATAAYTSDLDAPYKQGYGTISLATRSSDDVDLSINTVPLPNQKSITLKLNVNSSKDGTYLMTLRDIVAIPQLFDVWLMDAYKNDSLNIRRNRTYSFNIYKNDSTSFGAKRFSLVIRQNAAFAYRLLDFTAAKVASAVKQVEIIWKTVNEQNYTYFTVERSTDNGKTFNILGNARAASQGSYSLIDKSPVIGQNLYRLKQEDINSTISYSKVVGVLYADLSKKTIANNLSIFPNPVINTINLAILSKTAENPSYRIRFINSSGITVKQIVSSLDSWQGNVSNLRPGIYLIRIFNTKNDAFVAETKFVKI